MSHFCSILRVALLLAPTLSWAQSSPSPTVLTFDSSRGGAVAGYPGGSFIAPVISDIFASFPGATVAPSNVIDFAAVSAANTIIISSVNTGFAQVSPLTASEQSALLGAALSGKTLLLFTDNSADTGACSSSMAIPFGVASCGIGAQNSTLTVSATTAPPVSGPFGLVTSLTAAWPGFYCGVPSSATPIGSYSPNGSPGMLWIAPGSLGAGSGAVVFFSDTDWPPTASMKTMIKNTIAYGLPYVCPNGGGQANTTSAWLRVNDVGLGNCGTGPYQVGLGSSADLRFDWIGPPNARLALYFGPPNVAGANLGCVGTMDIGTPSLFYSDIIPFFDGLFVSAGASGTLLRTGGGGLAWQSFSLPVLPVGTLTGLQGVVEQPGNPCWLKLTASFMLTVP